MFTKRFVLVWAVAMMVWVFSAGLASAKEGPYIGIRGDAGFLNDFPSHTDVELPNFVVAGGLGRPVQDRYFIPGSSVARSEVGYAVRGAIGYAFRNNFRVEGEIGYRRNSLKTVDFTADNPIQFVAFTPEGRHRDATPIPQSHAGAVTSLVNGTTAIEGKVDAITLMANVYYDVPMELFGLKPYIGGGIGAAIASMKMVCIDEPRCIRARQLARGTGDTTFLQTLKWFDDGETVFAFQVMAGAGYDLELAGRPVTLTLDYSYFSAQDQTLKNMGTNEDFTAHFHGHYAGVGVRIPFGGE